MKRGNKYGARRTMVGDKAFPSALEASVYCLLLLRERAGEIGDIRLQDCVRFPGTSVKSKIDFSFTVRATGARRWAEAKGVEGLRWRVIKQLWVTHGPGDLEIWKGTFRRPRIVQVLKSQLNAVETTEKKQ